MARSIPLTLIVLLLMGLFWLLAPAHAENTPPPERVGIPGTHQDEPGLLGRVAA